MKLLFKPFDVAGGLLAGAVARRSFSAIWSTLDGREPPQPEQRGVGLARLALALSLEGAVFRAVRGLVDHVSRRGFASATGRWPGEDSGQAEEQ